MKPMRYQIMSILVLSLVVIVGAQNAGARAMKGPSEVIVAPDSMVFLGHSSVKIKTSDAKVIYIDPYAGSEYADSADIVLITHQHSDHNQLNLVRRKAACTVITNVEAIQNNSYKSFTVGNVRIDAVAAYNVNHPKSASVGFVLEFNGIRLYHAGDTGLISEMADLAGRNITYALLPMDGIYTMTPEEATQAASRIKAQYYVPIHTMPPPDTYSDAIVARFTVSNKIIVKNGQAIALSKVGTSVLDGPTRPLAFVLSQNYPNPFNPTTAISYQLAANSFVTLEIFDLLGREIATLVNGEQPAGRYTVRWDGKDERGESVSSGMYLYQLRAGMNVTTKRMVLVR